METTTAQDTNSPRLDSERRNESRFDEESQPFLPFSPIGGIHTKSLSPTSQRWTKVSQQFRMFLAPAPSSGFVKKTNSVSEGHLLSSLSPRVFRKDKVHQTQVLHGIDTVRSGQHRPVDKTVIRSNGLPSFSASLTLTTRAIIFNSWINVLLVFVPVAIVSYLTKAHPIIVFTTNAIAIIPLSGLLTYATECIASEAGDTIGALINISFGNLVEIVIL